MSEIDKIKRYIELTKIEPGKGDARTYELMELCSEIGGFGAVLMAFRYGRAKGYRAAKAEVRR